MDKHNRNTDQSEWKTGWVIVFSAFFLSFIAHGFAYSFGILLVELTDYFEEERATVAMMGATLSAGQYLTGQLTDAIGKQYGYRIMVVSGAVICCLGFIVSWFATSIYFLWVTYGLMGGIGCGLLYSAAISCVLQHFEHHRSLAMGITTSGTGVGTFVVSYLCRLLIDHFGWRGTILLQAGIGLHGVIFGLLIAGPMKKGTIETEGRQSTLSRVIYFVKLCFRKEVLTDLKCILFLLSNFAIQIAILMPIAFIPDQVTLEGMSKSEATVLVTAIGVSTTFSRILFGWMGDRICFRRLFLMFGVVSLNGVMTLISPFMVTFELKLAYTILFGSLFGAYTSLVYVVLTDIVKTELVTSALGSLFLVFGIASIVSLPIGGFLFDMTGSYMATFMLSGAGFIFGGCLLLMCQARSFYDGSCSTETDA